MKDVQQRLALLGLYKGRVDGAFGPLTKDAIMEALDRVPAAPQPVAPLMRTSPQGMAAIAAHEGCVPGPYKDTVGVWTIYFGHTESAGDPDPSKMVRGMPADINGAIFEGIRVFARDLALFEGGVRRAIKVPIRQHEFDAAVSFHFNTGAIGRASWVKSLNAGDRDAAGREIMSWLKPPEIKERREGERDLFVDGIYPDRPTAVYATDERGRRSAKPIRSISPEMLVSMIEAAQ